jgi:rhodanese-related sulfurtransferase
MVDNVAPKQVWDALQSDKTARLVDVRTDFEWSQIGVPDLSAAGQTPALVSWQLAPTMQVNPAFLEQLRAAGVGEEDHVYFLCRSGARSMAAAYAAADAGFKHVYNIADGFEGPPDGSGQRGRVAGWQADGLPWTKG